MRYWPAREEWTCSDGLGDEDAEEDEWEEDQDGFRAVQYEGDGWDGMVFLCRGRREGVLFVFGVGEGEVEVTLLLCRPWA